MALPHASPGQVVDVRPLGAALTATKTTALVKTEQFEAMRLVVPAGAEIATHAVPGEITLQCLEGRISLGLTGKSLELRAGEWVYLDGNTAHSLKGLEDASLLLMILLPRKHA